MRSRRDLVLLALALASLGVNTVLLVRWRAAKATPIAEGAPAALGEAWRRTLPGLRARPPVALDQCQARTAALAAQVAELDRLRQRHLSPRRRFDEAAPDAELTAALTAELTRQLPARLRALVTAECRGRLCLLAASREAQEGLAGFRESEWVGQNLHELAAEADSILFERHQPGSMRSSDLLQLALQDFEGSGAVEECRAKFRGQGTLDAQLSLEPAQDGDEGSEPQGIQVEVGGPLAGTELGKCIDAAFRQALMAITLPPRYERAALLAQFPRP
jgi:hypothetical protein